MNKVLLGVFAGAIAVIGALVWFGFENTKGNHLEPTGKLARLRTVPAGDNIIVIVADFNITNDADRPMQIRSIDAQMEMGDGSGATADQIPTADVDRMFKAFPILGERFNDPLRLRETIPGHTTVDRMLMFQMQAPEVTFEKRKRFLIRIEDVTGPVLELVK